MPIFIKSYCGKAIYLISGDFVLWNKKTKQAEYIGTREVCEKLLKGK